MLVVRREALLVGGGVGGLVGCGGGMQPLNISILSSSFTRSQTHGTITQCRQNGSRPPILGCWSSR